MAQPQRYSDKHRIFLQGIMCKGILDQKEVRNLYKIAMARVEGMLISPCFYHPEMKLWNCKINQNFSEEPPENVRENDMQAAQLVQRINIELDKNKLNMKIMKVCNGLIVIVQSWICEH